MLNINMEKVADSIMQVADQVIVPRFKTLHSDEIHFKSEDQPVTIADKEAEFALSTLLLDLLPGSKVVAEEAFAIDPTICRRFSGDSPVWVIDPLDGTKCFIAGLPTYGVIVALAEHNQTLAAWLYDPTSKEFIMAQKGAGAYHKGKKLSVLPADKIENMSGVLGEQIIHGFKHKNVFFSESSKPSIFHMTSACHDYARLVATKPHFSGQMSQIHFHSWLSTCSPWDCSAGVLIHREAGGYSAHWNGEPFSPCHYGRGILSSPDKESWEALKNWISSSCKLPE